MERITLGQSDLSVSKICLGCWQFNDDQMDGSKTWSGQSFKVSQDIVQEAFKCGINFFDTAEGYLNSESVLGRILEGKPRQDFVLATKFGYGAHKKTGFTAVDLEKSLTDSLTRLRTDHIDLYQCHWPPVINDTMPEIVAELKRQQSLGRIRYYGVSNFGRANLQKLLDAGGEPITNQICYNLLARSCEYEILPFCKEKNISVLAYSPLMQGLLSGKYLTAEDVPEGRKRTRLFASTTTSLSRHEEPGCEQQLFSAIGGVKNLCEEMKISMTKTSLSWLLNQSPVASVIVGAAAPSQVTDNCRLGEVTPEMDEKLKKLTEPIKEHIGVNGDLWGHASESRMQ